MLSAPAPLSVIWESFRMQNSYYAFVLLSFFCAEALCHWPLFITLAQIIPDSISKNVLYKNMFMAIILKQKGTWKPTIDYTQWQKTIVLTFLHSHKIQNRLFKELSGSWQAYKSNPNKKICAFYIYNKVTTCHLLYKLSLLPLGAEGNAHI